jgi:arabinose-5-phosphate isomerase
MATDRDTARQVIETEAEALRVMAEALDESIDHALDLIEHCEGKVIVSGIGKSGHVGRKLAATLASLCAPAFFLHAAEAVHGDFGMVTKKDVVILISHSGETAEVRAMLDTLAQIGCPIITITRTRDCSLARHANVSLLTHVAVEADPLNLAPTSSSTATLALGDALGIALAKRKGLTKEQFHFLHPGGALGARLRVEKDDGQGGRGG